MPAGSSSGQSLDVSASVSTGSKAIVPTSTRTLTVVRRDQTGSHRLFLPWSGRCFQAFGRAGNRNPTDRHVAKIQRRDRTQPPACVPVVASSAASLSVNAASVAGGSTFAASTTRPVSGGKASGAACAYASEQQRQQQDRRQRHRPIRRARRGAVLLPQRGRIAKILPVSGEGDHCSCNGGGAAVRFRTSPSERPARWSSSP